ncbi:hypothetical protein MVEN_00144400 [Mycena venus]|uniref:Uncharacterized protein n=1 Tax=Mycena venus TaxID=2733690 RepID=A0A8H6YXG1_9AGAR|nr:hypothetical protein MVEN_00144400 [Mycena venus]
MQQQHFSRGQRYTDSYDEDLYASRQAMDDFHGDGEFGAENRWVLRLPAARYIDATAYKNSLYRSVDPSPAYSAATIRGHGRSTSINPATLPNTIANTQLPRSRSTHVPNIHDVLGSDTPVRMGDLESLFERLSVQQEERHREETRELKEQNVALQARITSLEKRFHPPPSRSVRGLTTRGGGGGVQTRQRALHASDPVVVPEVVEGSNSVGAVLAEGEDADNEEDEGEPLTSKNKKPKYHTAIQKYSTQTFRAACGVKGRDWPDPEDIRINPTTGVKYLSPFFECDVTDPRNHAICLAVANQVDNEMKLHRPSGVPESAVWTSAMLLRCAKQSFRACKDSWKKVQNEAAAKRAAMRERDSRLYRRRCTKFARIETQIEAFATRFNIPVSVVEDLLTQELLSDEASGPEDEAEESFAAWKVRMAAAAGHTNLTPVALKDKHFVEVLECPWRSAQLSDISSSMQALYAAALNASGGAPLQVYSRANSYPP